MIDKDYFRRQATTLRKMVRATKNKTIADRLSLMADEFDSRSADGTDDLGPANGPSSGASGHEEGYD